jgi:hypothetical protein
VGPVPVTVTVYVPSVVEPVVTTLRVALPNPPVTVPDGEKLHVGEFAPDGATAQVRATLLVKPFSGAIVTVEVAELPGPTAAGLNAVADNVKAGCE